MYDLLAVKTSYNMICLYMTGYDSLVVTMEEGDMQNETDSGISFDFDSFGTHVYEGGLNGLALILNKTGFSLRGINSTCFKEISYCTLGVSVTLWASIDSIPTTSSKLQLVQIGGDPAGNLPGLSLKCETVPTDSDRVSCVAAAAEGSTVWTLQFPVQIKRWIHVCISWNPQRGLNVYLNGLDIQRLGVNATVMYNQTLGTLAVPEDLKIGATASDSVGVWRLDDIWLVERDITASETREHYGKLHLSFDYFKFP